MFRVDRVFCVFLFLLFLTSCSSTIKVAKPIGNHWNYEETHVIGVHALDYNMDRNYRIIGIDLSLNKKESVAHINWDKTFFLINGKLSGGFVLKNQNGSHRKLKGEIAVKTPFIEVYPEMFVRKKIIDEKEVESNECFGKDEYGVSITYKVDAQPFQKKFKFKMGTIRKSWGIETGK